MIRKSSEVDVDQLAKIWLEASLEAHHFIPASYWVSHLQSMREHYLPLSETYVWEDEKCKDVYGFISLVESNLAALFVVPKQQKKGIGKALVQFAKSLRDKLELSVYAENKQALSFYERMGFAFKSKQVDEATGQMEYLMEWRISST